MQYFTTSQPVIYQPMATRVHEHMDSHMDNRGNMTGAERVRFITLLYS